MIKALLRDAAARYGSLGLAQQIRWELSLWARGAAAKLEPRQRETLARLQRGGTPVHVNLGCGPLPKPGWLNVDGWASEADLIQHLGRPLDLPACCADLVFTEHVLEHLEYPTQVRIFLAESFRILQRGGYIRVIVPDAERLMRAYAGGDHELLQAMAPGESSPIEAVNRVFRENGFHRFAWDYDLARNELELAGFGEVRRAEFGDSAVPALNVDHDQPERVVQSLYVEARKPL